MAGPFDFLQNVGQDISGAENSVGGWLKGLLPSAPAQPQNPPLPTPSVSAPQMPGMSPTGGVSGSKDYMGNTIVQPQMTGQGFNFAWQHPGDFAAETGLTQAGWDFNTKLKNLGDQLGAARDLAGQDLTGDLQGLPGTQAQHQRVAKAVTDPIGYVNDVVQNFVQPAINPEMWFTPDTNEADNPNLTRGLSSDPFRAGFGQIAGTGTGHNYLRDLFSPAVKAVTGEDVPMPTTAFQGRAQALQAQQQSLMAMQTKLGNSPSQDDINAYNAKLSEYQANYNSYMGDYQKSANWWANSTTAKILRATGEGIGMPLQFLVGSQTFLPSLLANPPEAMESMIGQIQQGVSFAGALKDGSWKNQDSQTLVANISNLVNLGAMVYGGVKPLRDKVRKHVTNLQQNVPELANPPEGAVAKADAIQQARENSPVQEPPEAVDTRIADLNSSLTRAQVMLQRETDPVMKKALIEQVSGISDEIRNLQGQPRQAEQIRSTQDLVDELQRLSKQEPEFQPMSQERMNIVQQLRANGMGLGDIMGLVRDARHPEYVPGNIEMPPEGEDFSQWALEDLQAEYNSLNTEYQMSGGDDPTLINRMLDVENEIANRQGQGSKQRISWDEAKRQMSQEMKDAKNLPGYQERINQAHKTWLDEAVHREDPDGGRLITSSRFAIELRDIQDSLDAGRVAPDEALDRTIKLYKNVLQEIRTRNDLNENHSNTISSNDDHLAILGSQLENVLRDKASDAGEPVEVPESWEPKFQEAEDLIRQINNEIFPKTLGRFSAAQDTVRAAAREKLQERGPSRIAPEVVTDPTHPDYLWESDKVLGPNYSFLQPRPEDFSANARGPEQTSDLVTVYRGVGQKAKLPEWAKTNAGQWFTTDINKAERFAAANNRGMAGTVIQLRIPRSELDQFRAPEGNDPNEYLIPQIAQENYAKQNQGQAGQAGEGSTTSQEPNRPEGLPESAVATATIPSRVQGQAPVTVWETNPQSAGTVSRGGRTAQLEAKQGLIDAALKAINRVEDIPLRKILQRGIKEQIDSIPPEQMAQFIEERKRDILDTYMKTRAKYDPEGYVKHLVLDENDPADAYFNMGQYNTITFNPRKMLVAKWAQIMARYFNDHALRLKEDLTPEQYQSATDYLNKWTNATQAESDENTIAEEIGHAYDLDHHVSLWHYFRAAFSDLAWNQWAYKAGFGPPENGNGIPEIDDSLVGKLDRYMKNPNKYAGKPLEQYLFTNITELRANLFKIYKGAPLSDYTYRVPEVFRNELKNPRLSQEGAQIYGRNFETYQRPALRRVIDAQAARSGAVSAAVSDQGAAQATGSQFSGGPEGTTNASTVGSIAPNAASGPTWRGRSAGPNQASLTAPTEGGITDADIERLRRYFAGEEVGPAPRTNTPTYTTEGRALNQVQPPKATPRNVQEILNRTVVRQAVTDLVNAGWPEGKRWEQFARALNADPSSPEATEAYKILDKLPPKSQAIFTKVAEALPEPALKGPTIPGAQGEEATPEVPMAPSENTIAGPQFQYQQREIAAAQAKIETAGPIISTMEASGESLAKINAEKAGLADLTAYRDALQRGELPKRAAAIGRDAFARTMMDLEARAKASARVPELEEEPFQSVMRGKKYAAVSDQMAEFIAKRLQLAGYDLPVTKIGAPKKGIERTRVARLDDFFEGLFAEDRQAEKAYKLLPASTKEYLQAVIGYRGVPFRGKKAVNQTTATAPSDVAPGTENYINQTDLEGLEKVIAITPEKGGFMTIRHGSTARNGGAGQAERLRGWDDIPLNDQGQKQAEKIAQAFSGINVSVIYASPMKRSLDTANAISAVTGAKVVVDDNLKPWNIGEWSGKPASEFGAKLADYAVNRPDVKIPGGESFNDYKNRYLPAVKKHMQDALGLDGMTLEVNHTRGVRMVKAHVLSGTQAGTDINPDPIATKEEVGPGGLMGLAFNNGRWEIANGYLLKKLGTNEKGEPITKRVFSSAEASQKFEIPEGVKPVQAKPQKSLQEVYKAAEDPMVAAAKKGVRKVFSVNKNAAKIQGELPNIKDINSLIDNAAADPAHPANASAVEAKTLRDLMPAAQEMGGAAYERIRNDYAAALQKFTSRLLQTSKSKTAAAEAAAPTVEDKAVFNRTAKIAEDLRKRIDKGEDPDKVAIDAAKAVKMTRKQAISALRDKQWQIGKAKDWSPSFQDLILGKAAQKIRQNRLNNKPGRKTIPFEQADVITHEPTMKPSSPERANKPLKDNKPVNAIAETLQRSTPKTGKVVDGSRIIGDSRKEVTQKIADAAKKSSKTLRDETKQIQKQINTPSPNPFAGNVFTGKQRTNLVQNRAARRKAGLEEPGMKDGAGSQSPPPPDGPGNVLGGWDDARDPYRAFGGKHAKLAEVMDYLVKHYAKSLDPGSNQQHHFERARTIIKNWLGADRHLMQETIKALQDVIPSYKGNEQFHQAFADAVEERDDTARAEITKSFTPQEKALVDMWRSWEQVKGRIKVDNDLMKAAAEDYLAHILKFDENNRVLLGHNGALRAQGLSGRLQWWRDRAVDPKTGEARWPRLSDLRAQFGENNVEGDLAKIFLQENLSFAPRLRFHQLIQDMTQYVVNPAESFGLKKDTLPYEGHPVVPIGQLGSVPARFRDQLDTINLGPGKSALSMYRVYRPLKELIERQADINRNPLMRANDFFKIYKFALNPLHMYNVSSDIDAYLQNSHIPMAGVPALYKRIYDLKAGRSVWPTPVGELNWNEAITRMADNGATVREKLIDTANLGSLQGHIANPVKLFGHDVNVFNRFHDLMWVDGVWMGHIALTQHLTDFYVKKWSDANGGKTMNEAQFDQAMRLAAAQSNSAVGFLDRMDMTRNWNVIGNTVSFANAWSTLQIRNIGSGLRGLPGAKFLANFGGGERYLDTITKVLPEGGLTPEDMKLMNSVQGRIGRQLVVNGTLKLLVASTVMGAVGSYIAQLTGQPGAQLSLPWQNFQKDPTHTFDIYGGIDPQTGKQIWYHNPLYNAISEVIDYAMGSAKAVNQGQDWPAIVSNPFARYASGKVNPFISQIAAMATGQELNSWMEGYSNASIHNDPSVIAIENALSAKGINLPVGLEDRLIYAIREVGPVPGFAPTYGKNQTLNTAGDITNAIGPGKIMGFGDFMNAMQSGNFTNLVPTDLGNLAMFLTGSRKTETATPATVATDNQIAQATSARTAKSQLEQQMLQAAYKGDYKTVGAISEQLGYDNNQLVNALLYPPSGSGGGIAYHGTPYQAPASSATQDTLQGYTLTQGQTAELENIKKANFLAMYSQITSSPEWQASDGSERAAMIQSLNTQLMKVVEDQYAQNIGIMGGAPINNTDIQDMIDRNLQYRALVQGTLETSSAYINADSVERARMMKEYKAFADNIAYKSEFGAYKGVPPERVQELVDATITTEEGTRQYLKASVFYQMADQQDQARMLTEYGTLSRTIAERYALGQGQGSRGDIQLMASQVPMVIEKTIQIEETSKALLHATDYYQVSDLATQQSLDSKYTTLARSLAFSPTAYTENPDIIVENSIMAEEAYFGLQNQFGGGNYLKLMAQQLSDMELTMRQTADYSPQQIAAMEKGLRSEFLAQNPAYAAYLRAKTQWSKNTAIGQIYTSLNNSEYAAQDELAQADALSSSFLTSGTSSDPYFDPSANMGLTDVGLPSLGSAASNTGY